MVKHGLQFAEVLAMEDSPMIKIQKRLDLAVAVLTALYLSIETINVALELLSKVVNYGSSIRKLPILVREEWQADIRA